MLPTQSWWCWHLFVSACDDTHIFLPKKTGPSAYVETYWGTYACNPKMSKNTPPTTCCTLPNLASHLIHGNHEHWEWPSKLALSSLMCGFPAIQEDRYPKIARRLCVQLGASWFVSGLFRGGVPLWSRVRWRGVTAFSITCARQNGRAPKRAARHMAAEAVRTSPSGLSGRPPQLCCLLFSSCRYPGIQKIYNVNIEN